MKGMLVLLAFIVILSPLGAALDYSGATTPADPPSFDVTFSPDQTSIGFYDAEDKESSAVELALNGYKGEGSVTFKWDIIYSGTETLKFSLRAGGPLKLDPSDTEGADWEAYSDDNMICTGGLSESGTPYSYSLVVEKNAEHIRMSGDKKISIRTESMSGFALGKYTGTLYFELETQ